MDLGKVMKELQRKAAEREAARVVDIGGAKNRILQRAADLVEDAKRVSLLPKDRSELVAEAKAAAAAKREAYIQFLAGHLRDVQQGKRDFFEPNFTENLVRFYFPVTLDDIGAAADLAGLEKGLSRSDREKALAKIEKELSALESEVSRIGG